MSVHFFGSEQFYKFSRGSDIFPPLPSLNLLSLLFSLLLTYLVMTVLYVIFFY